MCFTFLEYTQDRVGIINRVIMFFGLKPIKFMESPEWFPWVYVLSGMWQGLGWWSINYVAALTSIDPTLYEAADIDGATGWAKFWKVTFPMLSPYILTNTVYTLIDLITSDRSTVLATIVNTAQSNINYSLSTAMAFLFFGVVVIILAAFVFVISRIVFYYD